MEATHLDGNGAAGLLQEVFLAEITTARRICQSCRAEREIGAHPAYEGPGVVLRCPGCEDVALVIGESETELVIEWRGAYRTPRA